MATMRQQLIQAIMGSADLNRVPNHWSPNLVKALVITRSHVIVVNHTQSPKIVKFNQEDAVSFIQANGNKGKLQNVLATRTLSCLEEIYVDSLFKEYSGALDLIDYINGLQSNVSRLRYFGYISINSDINNIMNCYSQAAVTGKKDYCYATDSERTAQIEIVDTGNDLWFKKHNLRPQDYPSVDKEGGNLDVWLRLVEKEMALRYSQLLDKIEKSSKSEVFATLVDNDLKMCTYYNYLLGLKRIMGARKQVCSTSINTKRLASVVPSQLAFNLKLSKEELSEALKQVGNKYSKQTLATFRALMIQSGAIINGENLITLDELNKLLSSSDGKSTLLNYKRAFIDIINNYITKDIGTALRVSQLRRCGIGSKQSGTGSVEEVKVVLKTLVEQNDFDVLCKYLLGTAGQTEVSVVNYVEMLVQEG